MYLGRDVLMGAARKAAPAGMRTARTARDAVTGGGGQPRAWDPAEVWRTRVRDVQDAGDRDREPREGG